MCIMKHAWVNRCFDDVIHYKLLHVGVESAEWLESSLSCSSTMMHQHCACFVGFTLWLYTDTAKYVSLEIQCVHTYLQSLQITCNICCKLEDNAWFASMCVDAALVAAFMYQDLLYHINTYCIRRSAHDRLNVLHTNHDLPLQESNMNHAVVIWDARPRKAIVLQKCGRHHSH